MFTNRNDKGRCYKDGPIYHPHLRQVRVSKDAYDELIKLKANYPDLGGRGIIGIIDKILFGKYTTQRVGRKKKQQ